MMTQVKTSGDIPKKMKAVVDYKPGDFRLEEVNVPQVGPGEVLIKVGGCGICIGDVKAFHGAARIWGGDGQPRYIDPPVIPGHEFYGQVVALGEGAEEIHGLSLGDWATSEQIVPCGACRFCRRGEYWMCEPHAIFGFKKGIADGGFAEYMKWNAMTRNHKLPEGFPLKIAPYIEPLGCGIHAVDRANIQLDDVVVIAGMGTLGLGMLQTARMKNPKLLIAVDLKPNRLSLAKSLGADLVMNPATDDVVSQVKDLTEGYGCDVYIQASGHPKGTIQGLQMIRRLGRFVEFSVYNEPVTVDWSIIGDVKELDILGAHLSPYAYPTAIRFLHEGKVKADHIITQELPLEDYMKGLEMMEKGDEAIKVLLKP
ncbi:MAG TPA: alcohol dehydrogenase catalytic domain-containing protein [Atribacteraceae bacterium]|nr:alcohol dehydrogenase catalytic domain-containing protein [Atribacteraceae bacterium]